MAIMSNVMTLNRFPQFLVNYLDVGQLQASVSSCTVYSKTIGALVQAPSVRGVSA